MLSRRDTVPGLEFLEKSAGLSAAVRAQQQIGKGALLLDIMVQA